MDSRYVVFSQAREAVASVANCPGIVRGPLVGSLHVVSSRARETVSAVLVSLGSLCGQSRLQSPHCFCMLGQVYGPVPDRVQFGLQHVRL